LAIQRSKRKTRSRVWLLPRMIAVIRTRAMARGTITSAPARAFLALHRLRREHSQGPVDRLAGDRLAVAQELADLPDGAPGRAEMLSGLHLPGRQPVLAPAVPAAEQISAKRICAAPT
jgi:hypothetical protein